MVDGQRHDSRVEAMQKLASELDGETDRALAVLVAAHLDHLLGDLLAATMVVDAEVVDDLLYQSGSGPLGTFSSRINAAYCLGLITEEEKRDLHLIRKVRNDFAHQLIGPTFNSGDIANRCREMKGAQTGGSPAAPRDRFVKTGVRLIVDVILKVRAQESGKASRQHSQGDGSS